MPLQFFSPIHKATRQLSLAVEDQLGDLGTSPQEGHLLTYLYRYAPAPIGELVRVFGHKQSTLTSILDRLETEGYLYRVVNPEDRRSFLIYITKKGSAIAEESNKRLEALEAKIRAHVSERDMQGFHAVLHAIEEVVQVRLRER